MNNKLNKILRILNWMANTRQHKFDEKSDKCVGCGLTEEQIEDRKITTCNGKLIEKPVKGLTTEVKQKSI